MEPGITLRCGSAEEPAKPFYATIGDVERAAGRRLALITITDPYNQHFNGWSFMAVDTRTLRRSCSMPAPYRALAPNFQESAIEWRKDLKRGEAEAYAATLQHSYEPFRSAVPPPFDGPVLRPGEKMWAQGMCTPNRQMEGQPECVIGLKRPLIDRLIDAVKP